MQLATGTKVKLAASILEDQTRKQSHSLFKRIIDEERIGVVEKPGKEKYHSGLWVKFNYGRILVPPENLLPID